MSPGDLAHSDAIALIVAVRGVLRHQRDPTDAVAAIHRWMEAVGLDPVLPATAGAPVFPPPPVVEVNGMRIGGDPRSGIAEGQRLRDVGQAWRDLAEARDLLLVAERMGVHAGPRRGRALTAIEEAERRLRQLGELPR